MSGQVRQLARAATAAGLRRAHAGAWRGSRCSPLTRVQVGVRPGPGGLHAAIPAVSAGFTLEQRHFSTSGGDAATPTLELTMADGQLTDVAAAVTGNSSGSEPWAVVQAAQTLLDSVHASTGLPWWATLMVSGITLRAVVFPLYVYQLKAMQRLMQARPDFAKLHSAYKYARTFVPKGDHKGHIDAVLLGRKGLKAVMKKYNTRPVQTVLGSVAYVPLFIIMAYSARDMVRSGNFAGMDVGGLLYWKNLIETDSTYVLPTLAALSTYGNLELSVRNKSGLWTTLLQGGQYISLLALPFLATLPQGVFFYWLGSSWSAAAQTAAMSNNAFRRRLGLRPRIDAPPASPAGVADMLGSGKPGDTSNTPTQKSLTKTKL